jgi:hypothetical protein
VSYVAKRWERGELRAQVVVNQAAIRPRTGLSRRHAARYSALGSDANRAGLTRHLARLGIGGVVFGASQARHSLVRLFP